MERLIDLLAHACAAKLVGVIVDTDEETLKAAVNEYPAIVAEMMRELLVRAVADEAAQG